MGGAAAMRLARQILAQAADVSARQNRVAAAMRLAQQIPAADSRFFCAADLGAAAAEWRQNLLLYFTAILPPFCRYLAAIFFRRRKLFFTTEKRIPCHVSYTRVCVFWRLKKNVWDSAVPGDEAHMCCPARELIFPER